MWRSGAKNTIFESMSSARAHSQSAPPTLVRPPQTQSPPMKSPPPMGSPPQPSGSPPSLGSTHVIGATLPPRSPERPLRTRTFAPIGIGFGSASAPVAATGAEFREDAESGGPIPQHRLPRKIRRWRHNSVPRVPDRATPPIDTLRAPSTTAAKIDPNGQQRSVALVAPGCESGGRARARARAHAKHPAC